MLTIKLPFTCTPEDSVFIRDLQDIYSPLIRTAYNRAMEGMHEKEIRYSMTKFGKLDSWFVQSCVREGMTLAATDLATKRTKKIFGGKARFKQKSQGKLSKVDWKESRLQPLPVCGEACSESNRKFKFQVIDFNKLIFKVNKNKHITLQLPKLRANYKVILQKLELAANNKVLPISIKITSTHICITYDEIKLNGINDIDKVYERHAGIDINPNNIGLSVTEHGSQVLTRLYDLSKLTKKSGKSSTDPKSLYLNNKLSHETIEIADDIARQLAHLRVSTLTLEDLKFSKGDKSLGKRFNRLAINIWKRNIFINQLVKRCKVLNIKVFKVHPAYTSFIGNLQHNYPDPISASVEISRRGFSTQGKKSDQFYPAIKIKEYLANQWKEALGPEFLEVESWKDLYALVKNSKLKYRVPLPPATGFRNMSSNKSKICLQLEQIDI